MHDFTVGLKFGDNAPQGVAVTQSALNEHLGSAGGIFFSNAVTLFAFSSVVGNYYYGQSNIEFLSTTVILFIFRCLVVVLVFVGAIVRTETVWIRQLIYGLNGNCKHYFHYRTVQCSFCIDERLSNKRRQESSSLNLKLRN